MTEKHPITPPPELVQQLRHSPSTWLGQITIAYQAGADQELEAMLAELKALHPHPSYVVAAKLRAARRPKPPSLKAQALEALEEMNEPLGVVTVSRVSIIRRALEALPND
jgi:hypothetical protein